MRIRKEAFLIKKLSHIEKLVLESVASSYSREGIHVEQAREKVDEIPIETRQKLLEFSRELRKAFRVEGKLLDLPPLLTPHQRVNAEEHLYLRRPRKNRPLQIELRNHTSRCPNVYAH